MDLSLILGRGLPLNAFADRSLTQRQHEMRTTMGIEKDWLAADASIFPALWTRISECQPALISCRAHFTILFSVSQRTGTTLLAGLTGTPSTYTWLAISFCSSRPQGLRVYSSRPLMPALLFSYFPQESSLRSFSSSLVVPGCICTRIMDKEATTHMRIVDIYAMAYMIWVHVGQYNLLSIDIFSIR